MVGNQNFSMQFEDRKFRQSSENFSDRILTTVSARRHGKMESKTENLQFTPQENLKFTVASTAVVPPAEGQSCTLTPPQRLKGRGNF